MMLAAIGSNLRSPLGGPAETVRSAMALLDRHNLKVAKASALFKSPAFPKGSGPDFVNAAVVLDFAGTPEAALERLLTVERILGRDRKDRWGPRTLDLDLLAAGDFVLPNRDVFLYWRDLSLNRQKQEAPSQLILPHPRMQDRAFVLCPLSEIAPDWRHPVTDLTVLEMLGQLPAEDRDAAQRLDFCASGD